MIKRWQVIVIIPYEMISREFQLYNSASILCTVNAKKSDIDKRQQRQYVNNNTGSFATSVYGSCFHRQKPINHQAILTRTLHV